MADERIISKPSVSVLKGARLTAPPDYYEVLQVSPNAEAEIIEAAYKLLVDKWHCERNPGDRSTFEHLTLLDEAYTVLSDPPKRQEYDLQSRQSAIGETRRECSPQATANVPQAPMVTPGRSAASLPTIDKAVGGRMAVAIIQSLVVYTVLGLLLPLTVAGEFVKMIGTIAAGVVFLSLAKDGSTAATSWRAELIWIALFLADGGLGIAVAVYKGSLEHAQPASHAWEQGVQKPPQDAAFYFAQGRACMAKGEYDKAIVAFTRGHPP